MRTGPRAGSASGENRLLTLLPPASRQRLRAVARPVPLPFGDRLLHQGDPIHHVYFPVRGVISLMVLMRDGHGVDAGTVGFEGMAGVPLVLGEELSPYETTVQVAGDALEIPADAFRALWSRDEALRAVILRYVEVLLIQTSRSAACNRLHHVEQRLARWLLQVHDWVGEEQFSLTQDFLAFMLGVRRATVSAAAGTLQEAGLITSHRGSIAVLDRPGLEDKACEDYLAIRDAVDRLLTLPTPRRTAT